MAVTRSARLGLLALAAALWLLVAWDGRLHWDEPGFLYQAAYQPLDQLLAAEFQPSGLEGFSLARVAHLLFAHGVCLVFGPGPVAFGVISGTYLVLLLGTLGLTYGMLARLLPSLRELPVAIVASAFTPVVIYLAFKTLQETPALFFGTLACYALVRAQQRGGWDWVIVIALSLAMVGLTKQTLALAFASFVPVLALWRGLGVRDGEGERLSRGGWRAAGRVFAVALVGGGLSLLLWAAALHGLGLSVRAIVIQAVSVAGEKEPVASMLLQTGLTAGVFYLALPLAFLSRRRGAATLLVAWFLLCTLPLILLTESIEVRYLAQNLPALCGLVALSLEGLRHLFAHRPRLVVGLAVPAAVVAVLTAAAAQLVLPHEVDTDDFATLLAELDDEHDGDYALLTAWDYTDFHYLRFMYPDRRVYNVHTRLTQKGRTDPAWTPAIQRRWYGERLVASPIELESTPGPWVYVGFEQAFPVANLRWLASFLPSATLRDKLDAQLKRMSPRRHIRESWLWTDTSYLLVPIARSEHYRAFAVERKSPPP